MTSSQAVKSLRAGTAIGSTPAIKSPSRQMSGSEAIRLLAAGDLYFLRRLIREWENDPRYKVSRENWNQSQPIKAISPEDFASVDIIFCDWCKEHAVHYSRSKLPHQKLIVRMIMYDTISEPATRVDWTAVDQIVFIIPDLSRRFHRANAGVTTPETVVRLDVDTPRFDLPKAAGASRRIGLLGFYEERKGPDVAVRLLERLHEFDPEYRLHFKGEHPWQRSYVWSREASRQFTVDLYSRIQRSGLADAITFSPHSPEVAGWFADIGIILSASTDESCHLAVAEGMASGAAPIIRNWNDADWMYPAAFVLPYDQDAFIDAAAGQIFKLRDNGRFNARSEEAMKYAREHFDTRVIASHYDRMFNEMLNGRLVGIPGE